MKKLSSQKVGNDFEKKVVSYYEGMGFKGDWV